MKIGVERVRERAREIREALRGRIAWSTVRAQLKEKRVLRGKGIGKVRVSALRGFDGDSKGSLDCFGRVSEAEGEDLKSLEF